MKDAPRPIALVTLAFGLAVTLLLSFGIVACEGTFDDETPSSVTPSEASIIPASGESPGARSDTAAATADVRPTVDASPEFPEIRYTRLHLADRSILDSIRKAFGRKKETMTSYRAITTLNRKELGYFRVGDTIVVPDTIVEDLRAYSVFPRNYPGADTLAKLIVVSNAMQSYACYEYGQLVRFAAANTGTESKPTFPGRYALNWKARLRISSLNDNWKLPYTWNFHKYAGNAFHQFEMPGRPVSHSCVRQFKDDAEWLFEWGVAGRLDGAGHPMPLTGTPVIITEMFDYTRKKGGPWLELASNRQGILELPPAPMGVEEALIPISQVPAKVRGGLPNRDRYKYAEDTLRARGIIRDEARLSASIDYNQRRARKWARRVDPPQSTEAVPPPAVEPPPPPPAEESAPPE